MTNNPFQSPQLGGTRPDFAKPPQRTSAPTGLVVISVICIVLGSFGLMGSCFGLAQAVIVNVINEAQEQDNALQDKPEQKLQKKIEAVGQEFQTVNFFLIGLNVLVAPLLLIGGIGCLNRKSWGHTALTYGTVVAAVFVFLRAIVASVMQFNMKDAIAEAMPELMPQDQNAEMAANLVGGLFWVAIIFSVLWVLAFLAFYLWSYFYLQKPSIKSYFKLTP